MDCSLSFSSDSIAIAMSRCCARTSRSLALLETYHPPIAVRKGTLSAASALFLRYNLSTKPKNCATPSSRPSRLPSSEDLIHYPWLSLIAQLSEHLMKDVGDNHSPYIRRSSSAGKLKT